MKTIINAKTVPPGLDSWYLLQHVSGERFIVNCPQPISGDEEIELLDENDEAVYLFQPGNFSVEGGPMPEREAVPWLWSEPAARARRRGRRLTMWNAEMQAYDDCDMCGGEGQRWLEAASDEQPPPGWVPCDVCHLRRIAELEAQLGSLVEALKRIVQAADFSIQVGAPMVSAQSVKEAAARALEALDAPVPAPASDAPGRWLVITTVMGEPVHRGDDFYEQTQPLEWRFFERDADALACFNQWKAQNRQPMMMHTDDLNPLAPDPPTVLG